MKPSGIITLLTDFGLSDPYVAMMKGVILSMAPQARVVDLCHDVTHGDISGAALMLQETYPFFPEGTIHVAVVDPGVGGNRRPILVRADPHFFVGPDNGVFWPIIEQFPESPVFHLNREAYFRAPVSRTFHGRDIFAPVAAHLARGEAPSHMGSPITDAVTIVLAKPHVSGDTLHGEVVRVDRFGNLITNITRSRLDDFASGRVPVIRVGDTALEGLSRTYSDVPWGQLLALIGSSDYLEIAVNLGRASDHFREQGIDPLGMEIRVAPR